MVEGRGQKAPPPSLPEWDRALGAGFAACWIWDVPQKPIVSAQQKVFVEPFVWLSLHPPSSAPLSRGFALACSCRAAHPILVGVLQLPAAEGPGVKACELLHSHPPEASRVPRPAKPTESARDPAGHRVRDVSRAHTPPPAPVLCRLSPGSAGKAPGSSSNCPTLPRPRVAAGGLSGGKAPCRCATSPDFRKPTPGLAHKSMAKALSGDGLGQAVPLHCTICSGLKHHILGAKSTYRAGRMGPGAASPVSKVSTSQAWTL